MSIYTKNILSDLIRRGVATIGDYTYGSPRVFYWDEPVKLSIGKFCSIAENVKIFLGGNHRIDRFTTYPFQVFWDRFPNGKTLQGHPASRGNIKIGNDVWIGYGAAIMSGVTIGDGAVISACSLVTRNVKPYAVVGGNPAEHLFFRFSPEVINILLKLQWWNMSHNTINENVEVLCSSDTASLEKLL